MPKDRFRLITGRYVTSTQSAATNNSMLRDIQDTNFIWINDKKAEILNINDGDIVEVNSSVGTIQIKAYPTNKIHQNVVWFAHGFGSQNIAMTNSYDNGANDNEIIEDRFEKIYGCATMHETDVTIRKL